MHQQIREVYLYNNLHGKNNVFSQGILQLANCSVNQLFDLQCVQLENYWMFIHRNDPEIPSTFSSLDFVLQYMFVLQGPLL
jgi:hypothetical protein